MRIFQCCDKYILDYPKMLIMFILFKFLVLMQLAGSKGPEAKQEAHFFLKKRLTD